MTSLPTPAQLGYRMPAEWEPQEAIWLSWPHKEASWPGNFEPVPAIFGEIAQHVTDCQLVRINVADAAMEDSARGVLQQAGARLDRVRFHHNPTNDAWVRDHGPIYVVREHQGRTERALTKWGYNAWGDKYPPYDLDNEVPGRIADEFGEKLFEGGMILEGGSIDVNGEGLLLTSEACLLNPNRNPQLTKSEIEQRLKDYLGVGKILWVGDGIIGDDTDGHIDDITRFVNPRTLVTAVEEDKSDENHAILQENLERLQSLTDLDGRHFEIVTLPMPESLHYEETRLPASYANFLIINTKVLVPTYRSRRDAVALGILQRLFPNREVVGIDCTELVWGLGAIHCVTQQQPAV
ncbi:agmatine deiminase family protein [Planctomicrobium piriforme]|uniref:Agmatine deiminase n=1 Tax=Planctomicrobium piriforme TaxID=1576369 RepID=A0A1I3KZF5_9PLAN|nr:agmatine deiminase family protein [Planctomicrobium piriforme]SFI77718.1 agmatine deiminase [Planctomicrobium piriforme]